MKKVLLFARDPGGANTVIPLVGALRQRGFRVRLVGKDMALARYRAFNYSGENLRHLVKSDNLGETKKFLKKAGPDLIITGTSANDCSEKLIWQAAATLGIPAFAVLDQWLNYGVRFSPSGVAKSSKSQVLFSPDQLPTKIFVMDEYAKRALRRAGIAQQRIVVSGQPYFDLLSRKLKAISKSQLKLIRKKLGISPAARVVVFASEPLAQVYGGEQRAIARLGYSEKTILPAVVSCLGKIVASEKIGLVLVVKIHPKEKLADFRKISRARIKGLTIKVVQDYSTWDLIPLADVVSGMISMFLIESVLFQKPTLSIQLGRKGPDAFILAKRRVIKSATTPAALESSFRRLLDGPKKMHYKFVFKKEASRRLVEYLEKFYV